MNLIIIVVCLVLFDSTRAFMHEVFGTIEKSPASAQNRHLLRRYLEPAGNSRNRYFARNFKHNVRVFELSVACFDSPGSVSDFIFFGVNITIMPNPTPALDALVVKTGFNLRRINPRGHAGFQS